MTLDDAKHLRLGTRVESYCDKLYVQLWYVTAGADPVLLDEVPLVSYNTSESDLLRPAYPTGPLDRRTL